MASCEKSSIWSLYRLSPRVEAYKGLWRMEYSHCSFRRSLRALRRDSRSETGLAAKTEGHSRSMKKRQRRLKRMSLQMKLNKNRAGEARNIVAFLACEPSTS